jgi:uncharacterized protein (TIGR03083 family)
MLPLIADERRLLLDRLAGLTPQQWATPSLCEGWTVHHVLAHLVQPFLVSKAELAVAVVRYGGIGAAMHRTALRLAERPTEELLAVLERNVSTPFHPPALPYAAPLTDVVAHGCDIRWVLDDDRGYWADPQRLRPVLDFLVGPRALIGFLPLGRLRGLRLSATDLDWAHGRGEAVRGPALALVMAVLGRPAAGPQLVGPGAIRLVGALQG